MPLLGRPLQGGLGLRRPAWARLAADQRRTAPSTAWCSAQPSSPEAPPNARAGDLRSSALPRVLRAPRDYGALQSKDFNLFVQFFRQASPYIAGHRGRTFVLAIPGEVGCRTALHRLAARCPRWSIHCPHSWHVVG